MINDMIFYPNAQLGLGLVHLDLSLAAKQSNEWLGFGKSRRQQKVETGKSDIMETVIMKSEIPIMSCSNSQVYTWEQPQY